MNRARESKFFLRATNGIADPPFAMPGIKEQTFLVRGSDHWSDHWSRPRPQCSQAEGLPPPQSLPPPMLPGRGAAAPQSCRSPKPPHFALLTFAAQLTAKV